MSHASLATSVVKIILNYEGSTLLNITFRAREFWVEGMSFLKCLVCLGIVFSSASILVGGFHSSRTNLHASLSIDFMKAHILAF